MSSNYTLVLFHEIQEYMEKSWFNKEAILYQTIREEQDYESSAYFIPTKYIYPLKDKKPTPFQQAVLNSLDAEMLAEILACKEKEDSSGEKKYDKNTLEQACMYFAHTTHNWTLEEVKEWVKENL